MASYQNAIEISESLVDQHPTKLVCQEFLGNHYHALGRLQTQMGKTADALATALMVLGPERGWDLASRNHIAALFIERKNGIFEEKATVEFSKLL